MCTLGAVWVRYNYIGSTVRNYGCFCHVYIVCYMPKNVNGNRDDAIMGV